LSHAGWFENLAGIVLGAFTEGKPGADGVTIDNVLEDQFACSPYPVLRGFSAGHIKDNVALTFGSEVTIEGGSLSISY